LTSCFAYRLGRGYPKPLIRETALIVHSDLVVPLWNPVLSETSRKAYRCDSLLRRRLEPLPGLVLSWLDRGQAVGSPPSDYCTSPRCLRLAIAPVEFT